jgi:tetratricopeptide (TPR) repeat protein
LLRLTFVVAFALSSTVALASRARAQDERLEEARVAFDEARAAFERGDYEPALTGFQHVYDLTGSPELLYNIAVAADRLERRAIALDAYERYRLAVPDTPDREAVDTRIEQLRREVDSAPPPEGRAADGVDAEPTSSTARSTPTRSRSSSGGRLFTWVALGASAAFGIAAAILWLDANAAYDELQEQCQMSGCTVEDVDESRGPLEVTLTNVGLALSSAALAAAVVLFVVEGGEEHEPATTVGVGPGTVVLGGSF